MPILGVGLVEDQAVGVGVVHPRTAVTPDRSVIVPMVTSVSLTPRVAADARPMIAGANRSAGSASQNVIGA